MSKLKIIEPKVDLIEKTAGEFAGVFYDASRSSGMTIINLQGQKINLLRYKGPRQFARAHLEKFIPAATHALIEILSKDTTSPEKKQVIYDALMERVNDGQLHDLGKASGLPEYQVDQLKYLPDDIKPKPIIVK